MQFERQLQMTKLKLKLIDSLLRIYSLVRVCRVYGINFLVFSKQSVQIICSADRITQGDHEGNVFNYRSLPNIYL